MSVNWYNGILFLLFTFLGVYDLTQADYSGCVLWLFGAILNLFIIVAIHQYEIYNKLDEIDKKITNTHIDIDFTGE